MVLCSGAFDGLHAGHVAYLEAAAHATGIWQRVRVAVAPDTYIWSEKEREPYWSQLERARAIEALHCVESAICHPEPSVAQVIRIFRPKFFVKGDDWQGRLPADVEEACGEVDCQIVYVHTPGRHVSEARG